jgi:hypothetical protein
MMVLLFSERTTKSRGFFHATGTLFQRFCFFVSILNGIKFLFAKCKKWISYHMQNQNNLQKQKSIALGNQIPIPAACKRVADNL